MEAWEYPQAQDHVGRLSADRGEYWDGAATSLDDQREAADRCREACSQASRYPRSPGVMALLLYRWRRVMTQGGAIAGNADEGVVGTSEVRRVQERVRDLERLLGRKTMTDRRPKLLGHCATGFWRHRHHSGRTRWR
jgi:hypothetical protein